VRYFLVREVRHLLAAAGVLSLVGAGASCGDDRGPQAGSTLDSIGLPVTGGKCPTGATMEGVDVSEWQESVNWSAVKASGRVFAIARLNAGTHMDPYFAGNWSGMKNAGLIRGVYQYYKPNLDPTEQANILVSAVGRLGPSDLPAMLDVEITGGESAATIADRVGTWLGVVEAGTGKKPLIYTGAYFWDDYVKSSAFSSYPLFIAWYGTNCPGVPNAWNSNGWLFHQYSSTGTVPGVSVNPTDLDVFNGTLEQLIEFAAGGGEEVAGFAPDFDGDGLGDLVGTWANGIMTGYVNTSTEGNPSFNIQKDIDYGWNGITRIVVVDIDNDGKRDLVGTWANGVMTAYRNLSARGSIYFGNQKDIGSGWQNITKIAVIDIDNDGKEDLVGTWTNGIMTAYLNGGTPGNPGFSGQKNIGTGWQDITKIAVIDIDNDGKQDLVATWKSGVMTAYLNGGTPGNPGFSGQKDIGSGWQNITRIAVIDIDNDGKQDLVGTWKSGVMTAYLSTGTPGLPGFGAQPNIGSGWQAITKIVVVDADGDGKQDLLGTWQNGVMTAYLSKGTPGQPGFGTQKNIGTGWQGITRIAVVR
jgi:GH25 family lysozyme M1 (1,4-beta-N-acetylmuramidase)